MSERVVQQEQPAGALSVKPGGVLQRKCACGQHTIAGGECEACGKQRLQHGAVGHTWEGEAPTIVHEALSAPGQPLDSATRALVEPRFGHDFSRVRIHTDERASESSRALDAHAFTTANDVVFGQGKYSPDTPAGLRLLTHELSHVVHQETSGLSSGALIQRQAIKGSSVEEEVEEGGKKDAELGEDTGEAAREALGWKLNVFLRKPGRVNCIPPNWQQLLRETPDPTLGDTIQGENVKKKFSIGTLVPQKGLDRPRSYTFRAAEKVVGTEYNENIVGTLSFDDLIFVEGIGGKDNQWYRVTTNEGLQGWVPVASVTLNPPEPEAHLHRILGGETPLGLVARWYKPEGGFQSRGEGKSEPGDARFYVGALAFANRGRAGMPLSADPGAMSAWEKTGLIEGTHIWIPSKRFLDSLKGVVSSGSITDEIWDDARLAAKVAAEGAVSLAGFIAGLFYGAGESLFDLFAGAVELIKLIWKTLESLFTGNIVSDAKTFWKQLQSLDISKLGEEFDKNWNSTDLWDAGFFKGRVFGYIIMEILIAYFSVGIGTALKWTGKFARIGALIAKLPKVNQLIKGLKSLKISQKASTLLKSRLALKTEKTAAKITKEVEKGEKTGVKVLKGVGKGEKTEATIVKEVEKIEETGGNIVKDVKKSEETGAKVLESVEKEEKIGATVIEEAEKGKEAEAKILEGVKKGKVEIEAHLSSKAHLEDATAAYEKYIAAGGKRYKSFDKYKEMYDQLTRNRMTGTLGEKEFQLIMKGKPEKFSVVVGGKEVLRKVDNVLGNVAREIKTGYLKRPLSGFIKKQMRKDIELMKTTGMEIEWHLLGGGDAKVIADLKAAGFKVFTY
jgi:hypothetical protein